MAGKYTSAMAQVLNLIIPSTRASCSSRPNLAHPKNFAILQHQLYCNGRFSCLFSDNRKQEQARKALESALGGKKNEFEKWDREIKRREEVGGGDGGGGGGWFGWGGRFGGSNGDHFWQEAQQTGLTILGIIIVYLMVAKGHVIVAAFFNPLLFALRSTRNGFTYMTSMVMMRKPYPSSADDLGDMPKKQAYDKPISAKESVVKKWASD
ncbi:hypothetical protein Nepgr_028707 [Nepenthes gracilis]|uniref:Uncharacterized protein n=1 Tax=Nepenthes gracilis TaxID=150966 RepID=A0AAD3Y4C2_NEPGR|nr:hypothetical protein Nepgr_028707 [Nepenthes gracilis]